MAHTPMGDSGTDTDTLKALINHERIGVTMKKSKGKGGNTARAKAKAETRERKNARANKYRFCYQ